MYKRQILRSALLGALSDAGDEAVVAQARHRFQTFLARPAALQGDARGSALAIVATHADAATWQKLHTLAHGSKTFLEQSEYLQMLARPRDPALARRTLELALSGEFAGTLARSIIRSVAWRHASLAFDFVDAHWAAISLLLEPSLAPSYAASIAQGSDDPDTLSRLMEFADRNRSAVSMAEVKKATSAIRYRSSIRQERLPQIDRWLAGSAYAIADRWTLGGAGGWDLLTYQSAQQRLFVTRPDRVEVVDTRTGRLSATIPGTDGAHQVACLLYTSPSPRD